MIGRVNTDIQSIKIIYNRNKHFLIPFFVILICIGLIVQVIVPQIRTFFKVREEAENASRRLADLKKDLEVLSSLDENMLESQLKITSFALPINKDFGGILSALYSAAQAAGVNVGAFSFQLGDLSKSEEKDAKFPSIELTVNFENDIGAVNNFIDIVGKTLPISDISAVSTDNDSSSVSLLFYYKVLSTSDIQKDERIVPISNDKLSLLDKLNTFNSTLLSNISSEGGELSTLKTTNPFAD